MPITPPPYSLYEMGVTIYRKILPSIIKIEIWRFIDNYRYKLRKNIIKFLKKELKLNPDIEKKEIFNFLKRNPIAFIPYEFKRKYKPEKNIIYEDDTCDMKYLLHENKRLYFPKKISNGEIQRYYNGLMIEQDINSPHRYEHQNFYVQERNIVADIGAAEGFFALSIIERARKIYLFECNSVWINALKMTFLPWKEKITIINKYVSNHTVGKHIALDDYFNGEKIDFIKADIEGSELDLLLGSKRILSTQNNLRIVLCTYHRKNDMQELNRILLEGGFYTEYSNGYIINIFDKELSPPYLRRGIIRALKK
jgi:hypothetical protein